MKMKMRRIDELFDVKYGVNLELNALSKCAKNNKNAVNFVSRATGNNGITAVVEKIANVEPIPAGTLSVAAGGSVLETYLQAEPYYSGRDLYYLSPKMQMTDNQKLYYCMCIRANKYRYNYGRQANKTLGGLLVPDLHDIPQWINTYKHNDYSYLSQSLCNETIGSPVDKKYFVVSELFDVVYPKTLVYADMIPNEKGIPFVSSKAKNNGVVGYVEKKDDVSIYPAGCITVPLKGSVLCSSVQIQDCYVAHQIAVLTTKEDISIYAKMYLATIINANKFRFNYGRQADNTLKSLKLLLPVNDEKPDWAYMEKYIKSLRCSAGI